VGIFYREEEMNTVNCVVCKAEVSKRQSLAFKDGRACRTHPEVQVELQKRLSEEEKKRMARIQAERQRHVKTYGSPVPLGPECWSCRKPGINAREHWLRMAIAVEKCALKGKSVFDASLSFAPIREEYGEQKLVLVLTPVPAKHPLVEKHAEIGMMHSMTAGHLCICQECAKRNGLVKEWERALSPDISPEMWENWMKIAPILPQNEVIQTIAKIEVIAEQPIVQVAGEKELSNG
jgi:hypothetical protein